MSARLIAEDPAGGWVLWHGDVFAALERLAAAGLAGSVDAVFADPPYFIGKASWDKRRTAEAASVFHELWLRGCLRLLKSDGSIWITGTHHVIPAVGTALQRLDVRVFNAVTWEKPNPTPCRARSNFKSSTELVLWTVRQKEKPYFDHDRMKEINGGTQMGSHWRMSRAPKAERMHGYHPTQKPVALVERCLLATTHPSDLVLDPFIGSGTTAVAALRTGRRCVGIDRDLAYLRIARHRLAAEVAGAWLDASCAGGSS